MCPSTSLLGRMQIRRLTTLLWFTSILLAAGGVLYYYAAGAIHIASCRQYARALEISNKALLQSDVDRLCIVNFTDGDYAVVKYMPKDVLGIHPGFDYCFVKTNSGRLLESRHHFCVSPEALDYPVANGEMAGKSLQDLLNILGPFVDTGLTSH